MKSSRLAKLAWWTTAAVIAALLAAVQMAASAPAEALTSETTSGQSTSVRSTPATAAKKKNVKPVQRHFQLRIGGAEAAGQFKEATGFDSESTTPGQP